MIDNLQEEMRGLQDEGMHTLALIVHEWESDPISVQCFDLRLVKRAKYIIGRMMEIKNG